MVQNEDSIEECPEDDFKPRPYQDQILEIALRENVVIYLPTGAGKTHIALMAIRRMSSDLKGSLKDGAKRTVFLCNTVALAKQQCDVIKRFTNLKVSVYTGDMNVDNWKDDKWSAEFEMNQVIVATVQIIVDVIRHGYMSLPNFNLIIFDECHHAKGEHPMFQLMNLFKKYPENKLPRVIGLTGLLINPTSKQKIVEDLNNLEATFRGKIVTVENFNEYHNVLIYSTKPLEVVLTFQEYYEPLRVEAKVENYVGKCLKLIDEWNIDKSHIKLTKNLQMERAPNPIKNITNLLKDFLYQMKDMGVYAASIAILAVLIELELKKKAAETIKFKNLLRACISYADRIRHVLVKSMYAFDDDDDEEEDENCIIRSNSTPKLQTFLRYLQTTFSGKNPDDIKCLVFVQRRHTAKCLYHIIKRWVKYNPQVKIIPEFMVGHNQSMPESVECVLDAKWNKNVLQSFKKNESNLIVCSSVLEEGIDIQSCNHVIIFDKIQTFRSYVQSKGRARKNDSKYVIMVPANEKMKMLSKINEYKEIDAILKNYLIGKAIDRKPPLKEDIDKQFKTSIKPFYTPMGACLEATSAVQLLNRYCMMLPNDSFTVPSIDWKKSMEKGLIFVRVFLPLQSALKHEIWSDPQSSVRIARQSAAFNACKALYELGELNDNLLPISKKKRAEIVGPIYFKHWDDFKDDDPKTAGTKQNRRLYNVEHPYQLCSAMPLENSECYLYTITISPKFECNEDNEHLVNLFSQPNTYGILTSKLLPKIAEMPLFMNYGQVNVKISYNPVPIKNLSRDDISYLRNFHVMIFRDLLQIWKDFLAYDYRNKENSFLIVPTLCGNEINWDLVKRFQNLSAIKEPSEIQRARMCYNKAEDYFGNIVCPWYSVDTGIRYVIIKIRYDLTPFSPFPNQSYRNFSDYVFDKYQKRVVQTDQFLLEAKAITTRTNFLNYSDEGGKKKKRLDDILLIPELCHNFFFPGDMYLKAKFLPSILHRLHYILIAENLRIKINEHLKLNFPDYTPSPLIIDMNLKRIQSQKTEKTVHSVVLPDYNEKSPVPLVKANTITESSQYKWKEYEEPCDLTRMFDSAFKIELDYYYQFITNKLNKLSISNNEILPAVNKSVKNKNFAICDVPLDEKLRIKIIEIMEPQRSAEQWEFLSAITAASAADVFDMERVELLGDSFLKLGISLFLLHKHPTWNEGHLTSVKGKFVSNRNLLYCAIKNKLTGYLCISQFSPRDDWLPPLLCVPSNILEILTRDSISPGMLWELKLNDDEIQKGECKETTILNFVSNFVEANNDIECDLNVYINKQVISDKTIADSIEAILGVCVKNYGIRKTFSVLELLGICPEGNNLSNLLNLDLGNPRLKTNISDKDIDAFLINYEQLEQKLGYKFNDRAYMLQALTHPSYPTNRLTGCYQQLEFVGDAILDFLVSCYIFERCTDMDPGKLTDLRSALVNNVTLACIAVRNKFHLFMLQQSATLSQSIEKFTQFQETQNMKVTDQVRVLIQEDENEPNSMADYIDVPKALGDIFESLIGAVFLDSKNNLKITWQVIYNLMKNEIDEFMTNVPIQTVRQLYEYHGANPQFSAPIDHDDFVVVTCKFTCREKICEVSGFAQNKHQAKIAAAKLALQALLKA